VYFKKEQLTTARNLMNTVLKDNELQYFSNHTGSFQSWVRYIIDLGLMQLPKDFDKWKKMKEIEDGKIPDSN